jgi:CMP-N-acetylneuraminic acid synthetase
MVHRVNGQIVGIIPARGGSRRVPLKNLAPLKGRPLISYMIEAAKASLTLNRLIVSTDHDEIAKVAVSLGVEVPFRRPADLAEDVPMERVIQHAVHYIETLNRTPVSVAVTLQPTSPFCTAEDIDACVGKLLTTGADSVITVTPIHQRPEWMFRVEGDRACSFLGLTIKGEIGSAHNLPPLYIPTGAVYATRRHTLMEKGLITGPDTRVVIVPHERAVDIDLPIDLLVAEVLAERSASPGATGGAGIGNQ